MITINLNQHTLLALFASISLLTIATLGYEMWQWRSDWQLAHQSLNHNITSKNTADINQLIMDIPNQHLFGKALTQGAVPVTNLQMQVTGIVKNNDDASKVYISISGQPSKIYRTGDTLPYGVKIYKITADTVIFENDGRLEKLSLAREKLEFKPKGSARNA